MERFPRPTKKPPPARNGSRQIAVVVALATCLGVGVLGVDHFVMAKHRALAAAAAAAAIRDDADIYTGSILVMPDRGSLCRQLLFNNQNGDMADNGYVDCDRAAYRSLTESPKTWSAARVRVISTGFRDR